MPTWQFKACPRCNGDLYVERDKFGWHSTCLQCGHIRDLEEAKDETNNPTQGHLEPSTPSPEVSSAC